MVILDEHEVIKDFEPVSLLEKCGALLYGEFTLASGKTTDYYFDSKKLTLDPDGAEFVAKQLVRKLHDEKIKIVGGTAYSAIPIASHICLFSKICDGPEIPAFYIRKESKGHGTDEVAEGTLPGNGVKVAIVEDVVTSGGSLIEAIKKFKDIVAEKDLKCDLTHAIALVDRGEGGREAVEALGYEFWSLFTVLKTEEGKISFRFNGFSPSTSQTF